MAQKKNVFSQKRLLDSIRCLKSVRTIPDAALPYFWQLKIENIPQDYYLFSWNNAWKFEPGPVKYHSRYIARYLEDFVMKNLGWGQEKQFYSLKDTGITNMAGYIALPAVQGQADHSSLAITSIYISKKLDVQKQIKIEAEAREFNKN